MSQARTRARYTLRQRLATGGMAEVYLGEMEGLLGIRKPVVVKRILPDLAKDPTFVEMFLDEARVAATLQHPNIVQTYDVVEGPEGYFLTMEYLRGADLRTIGRHLVKTGRSFPVDIALQIVMGLLAGLHYAHEATDTDGRKLEIVHRDVSPHNTFVTWDGAVKVLDFGVARALSNRDASTSKAVRGKIRYLSPEQSVGAAIDRRSDLYSAGVVLYELLTQRRVHEGSSPFDILRRIIDETPPPPSHHRKDLPAGLDAILVRALAKKRSKRYPSARAFQRDLEELCRTERLFLSPLRLGRWLTGLELDGMEEGLEQDTPATDVLRSTLHVSLTRKGGSIVARFRGRLGESFDGQAIGEQLEGPVVFDLDQLEGLSSFGIRGWLQMLEASKERITGLYFVRCPPAFLQQASMVRRLLGQGVICSIALPMLSEHDGIAFQHLVAGEELAEVVLQGRVPVVPCPGAPEQRAGLDDDLGMYRSFAQSIAIRPPRVATRVMQDLATPTPRPDVVSDLHTDETRLTIRRPVDATAPWRRIVDGLEGHVTLDFFEAPAIDADGLEVLVERLEKLGTGIDTLDLEGLPVGSASAFARSPSLASRTRIVSYRLAARCPRRSCPSFDVRRPTRWPMAIDAEPPRCPRCNTPLEREVEPTVPASSSPTPPKERRAGCFSILLALLPRSSS